MKKQIAIIMILLLSQIFNIYCQEKKYIRKGNRYYKDKKYQQAEIMYQKALDKNFSSKEANFNLGNTFYREEKFDAAIQKFENVANSAKGDSKEKSKHFYNLGNAYFKNKKIKESIDAYKKALKYDPYDNDIKHNLQLAIFMMKNQNQGQGNQNKQNNNDNNNQQQEQKQKQQNQKNEKQERQGQQNTPDQISKEDAERLLNEIYRREKEILQQVELHKRQLNKTPVEKNW